MSARDAATAVPERRIEALDALRGIALCGILLMNLPGMAWVYFTFHPLVPEPGWNAASAAYWIQRVLFEGTMRGLFSMLFGAGLLLFLAKAERGEVTRGGALTLLRRRLGWLFVFGVIDATLLLWPGDILTIYAIAGGLLMLFALRASVLALAGWAALFLALHVAWSAAGAWFDTVPLLEAGPRLEAAASRGAPLADAERATLEEWRGLLVGSPPSAQEIAEARAARLGGYLDNLRFQSRTTWAQWLDWGSVAWILLDALTTMLIGMALFRLGVLQGQASPRLYRRLVAVGYGLGLPLHAWLASFGWRALDGWSPAPWELVVPEALYQVPRLLVTLGHLGLFHVAWRARPRLFAPLGALGRLAFTGYLGQSVLAACVFSGFGLGLWGRFDLAGLFGVAAAIWVVQLAGAWWWTRAREMGPLEALWQRLTYGPARTGVAQPL